MPAEDASPPTGPARPAELVGPTETSGPPGPSGPSGPSGPASRAADVVDVFVYVVVLGLFVEYLPAVISETFTLSLLTAVLLKAVLEVVVVVKKRARARFTAAGTAGGKVGAGLLLWAVLVGSKFVVLKAVDLVFGDAVSLGGFVSVTLLIITLLVSRLAVRRLLEGRTPVAEPVA
ncbi:hypothetical protein [Terrabacter carboxydivorans]|uniref:hypothetical protein n=1 Tax=Terrabacter carboxydivorans TaxID=619730 RepID=UPI0031D78A2F